MRISHFKSRALSLGLILLIALSLAFMPPVKAVPENAVLNPGFELDTPYDWVYDQWANSKRNNVQERSGSWCIELYSANVYQEFSPALEVDEITEFTFWIKTSSGSYGCEVTYEDDSTDEVWVLKNTGGVYEQIDFIEELTSGKAIKRIQLMGGTGNVCYYDDFVVMYDPVVPLEYTVNLRRFANGTVLNDAYNATITYSPSNNVEIVEISADDTIVSNGTDTISEFIYPDDTLGEGGSFTTLEDPSSPITPVMKTTYGYVVNLRRWENGTTYSEPYTASIVEEDGYLHSVLIDDDGIWVEYYSTIFAFTYPLSDEDEFRTLYSPDPDDEITPVIPGALNDQYLFTIKDLTGYLSGKTSTLEVWKNVGAVDVIVDSALVTNTVNGIPLRLTRYALVYLKLLLPNGERYDFGSFMPTGNPLTVTLVFNYSDLDDTIIHFNKYVTASAERSLDYETITVEVENTLTVGYTFTSEAILYMRNGTVVDTQNSTANSETFTFANLTASQDYIVMLELTHSYFPGKTFKASWTLAGSWTPGNDEPFPDFGDMGWTFGGVTQIIGVILVLITAGLFSYVSAPVGIMFTILVAGMLNALGILTVTSGTLTSVFSLGMILIFGRRNNG